MKIFIKTYDKDAEWLKYALQSIQVHASDYASDVVVATETEFLPAIEAVLREASGRVPVRLLDVYDALPEAKDIHPGYFRQVYVKMMADKIVGTDHFQMDSDMIFWRKPGTDLDDVWYYGRNVPSAWSEITSKLTSLPPDGTEHMRTAGQHVKVEALRIARHYLTGRIGDLAMFCTAHGTRDNNSAFTAFSEYDVIGRIVREFAPTLYNFRLIDAQHPWDARGWPLIKGWSWGGLDARALDYIQKCLRGEVTYPDRIPEPNDVQWAAP